MVIALHGTSYCRLTLLLFSLSCLDQLTFIVAQICTSESPYCVCSYDYLKEDLRETILNSEPTRLISRIRSYECQQYREIPTVLHVNARAPPVTKQAMDTQRGKPPPNLDSFGEQPPPVIQQRKGNRGRKPPPQPSRNSNSYGGQPSTDRRDNEDYMWGGPQPDYPFGQEFPESRGQEQFPENPRGPPQQQRNGGNEGGGRRLPAGGRHQPHFGYSKGRNGGQPSRPRGPQSGYYPKGRQRRDVDQENDSQRRRLQNAIPKLTTLASSTIDRLYAFLGHGIQISCSGKANAFVPSSSFTWIHSNGDPISAPAASINELTGELVIPAVQLSDTDVYNCTMSNERGQSVGTFSHQLSVVTDAIHWLSVETRYHGGPQCSPQQAKLLEQNIGTWIRNYICPVCTVHESSVICDNVQGESNYEIKFALTAFNFEYEIDKKIDTEDCPELCVQALHLLLLNIMKDSLRKLFALPRHYSERGNSVCMECHRGQYQPAPGSSACLPCDEGQDTLERGSTSYSDCLPTSIVEAYHTAEKNSAAAIVFGVLFSILFFIIILLVLFCCCCPNTKLSESLRKCFYFPCNLYRRRKKPEEDKPQAERKDERRSSTTRMIESESRKSKVSLRKSLEKLSPTSLKSTEVKYSQLRPETTTTDASEPESENPPAPPSPRRRRSVETQVAGTQTRPALEIPVKTRHSSSPPRRSSKAVGPIKPEKSIRRTSFSPPGSPLPRVPSPMMVEKAVNVPERRRSSLIKEPICDDGELEMLSSDVIHEEYTPRVKDTVAKINAVTRFNKLYQEASQKDTARKASGPSRRESGESGRRRLSLESEKPSLPKSTPRHSLQKDERRVSTHQDQRRPSGPHDERRPSGHHDERRPSGHHDERRTSVHQDERRPSGHHDERRSFGHQDERRPSGYQDERKCSANHDNHYQDNNMKNRTQVEPRRPSFRRDSGDRKASHRLRDDMETSGDDRQLNDQWENYCHTCIRPSLKKKQTKYSLPPPPPPPLNRNNYE